MHIDELYDAAWDELSRGTDDAKHGFHLPVIATVAEGRPQSRVVVLRVADQEHHMLMLYTDRRAAKVRELASGIAWTFYDAASRLQLRAWGPAELAKPDLTDLHWQASWLPARKSYLSELAPGTEVDAWTSGFPPHLLGRRVPNEQEAAPGRENFAVVMCQIQEMEVLRLGRQGHQRARFTVENYWGGRWLVP